MLQKSTPFQILEEEYYQENLIRAKPSNPRKTLPSMMLLLITFTNNPTGPHLPKFSPQVGRKVQVSAGTVVERASAHIPLWWPGPHSFTGRVQIT